MPDRFAAQIAAWVEKAKGEQVRILQAATLGLVDEVTKSEAEGGRLPVVTGNLRNSVAVSTLGPVTTDWKTKKFRDPTEAVKNAIEGFEPGKTAYIGFRAPYASKIEEEKGFIRLAAQNWSRIVDEAVKARKG